MRAGHAALRAEPGRSPAGAEAAEDDRRVDHRSRPHHPRAAAGKPPRARPEPEGPNPGDRRPRERRPTPGELRQLDHRGREHELGTFDPRDSTGQAVVLLPGGEARPMAAAEAGEGSCTASGSPAGGSDGAD